MNTILTVNEWADSHYPDMSASYDDIEYIWQEAQKPELISTKGK